MMLALYVLLIAGGFAVRENPHWFNGADTVGIVMIIGGVALIVFTIISLIAVGREWNSFRPRPTLHGPRPPGKGRGELRRLNELALGEAEESQPGRP